MQKTVFIGLHYGALLLFSFSCWGWGRLVVGRLIHATPMTHWLGHALLISAGMGATILALQLLGIMGLLNVTWLLAVLGVGWIVVATQAIAGLTTTRRSAQQDHFPRLHWTVWLLLLLVLGTLLLPLRPPYRWDELSFHLPYAQQWAQSGKLSVVDWLRYPWAPLNFNLLYAAALVLYDDVMPHLLHSLTGWVVAMLLYQLGVRHTSRVAAASAAIVWLLLIREDMLAAYVDMAVALFVLAGWTAFLFWQQTRSRGWLALAAFLLGTAAGSKYQALAFLPFFAVVLLLRDRRWGNVLVALGFGLLPCVYWYIRNAVMTGDPFNPLGGNLFGFHDWNAIDMELQLLDLRESRNWPSPFMWPALAAPLFISVWRHAQLRLTMYFCAYAFVTWLATSHYARYLMPAYPMLLLLAAHVVWTLVAAISSFLRRRLLGSGDLGPLTQGRIQGAIAALLILLSLQTTARSLTRDWRSVAATLQQRQAFLSDHLWQYQEVFPFLHRLHGARIYQSGTEGALYYAPHPIWGDYFGRWRYRDYLELPPAELAAKLSSNNFDTIVFRLKQHQRLLQRPNFAQCFKQLHIDHTFGVYRVAPPLQCKSGVVDPHRSNELQTPFVVGPSLP